MIKLYFKFVKINSKKNTKINKKNFKRRNKINLCT